MRPTNEQISDIFKKINESWNREVAPILSKPESSFKSDLKNAAYRVTAKQLLTLTKAFFIEYARKNLSDESKMRAVVELLDTELGTAFTSYFIGFGLSQIPNLENNPKAKRLLKEFRVNGMATAGNNVAEALITSLLPIIHSTLEGISKVEQDTDSLLADDAAEEYEAPGLVRALERQT